MALVGPTAAGKSALAMELAESMGAEILSVDSMQVYRGMDIGTAKPTPEERKRVPHHMIDLVEPEDRFTVADFRLHARAALGGVEAATVLIVGGSGLHFRAVVDPMVFRPFHPEVAAEVSEAEPQALVAELLEADPAAAALVDLANPRRVRRAVEALRVAGVTPSMWAAHPARHRYARYQPELPFTGIGIDHPDIEARVDERLRLMRQRGFLEEVARLQGRLGVTASQAVGYRQLLAVVEGRLHPDAGFAAAKRATMALVKRQRTFWRRDPRLTWVQGTELAMVRELVQR